jgi:hypothetical protein
MATPLGNQDAEPLCQCVEVVLEEPRVDQAAMQQDEGYALAALLVPGAESTNPHITSHPRSPLVHWLPR